MVETKTTLTCPHCDASYEMEMPTEYCQIALECSKCGKVMTRKEEDCCVFCSYADKKCPSMQECLCGIEETPCPICSKVIRSDAEIREFCKLCGMGIPDHSDKPRYKTKYGRTFYFCNERCLSIYNTNIIENKER